MSELDLDAIRARAATATPGPWWQSDSGLIYGKDRYLEGYAESVGTATPGNEDFIAHAREDVPALVAKVDRLRKIVSDILNVISWEPDPCPVHPEDDSPDDVTVCGWKVDIGQIRGILTAAGYDLTPQSEAGESDEL